MNEADNVDAVKESLTQIVRPMYGNPCRHPARIIEKILLDPQRRAVWKGQLSEMVQRIMEVKKPDKLTLLPFCSFR